MSIPLLAWRLYNACQDVERCLTVIAEYSKLGISGTIHDLEHRDMLVELRGDRNLALDDLIDKIREEPLPAQQIKEPKD